MDRWMREWSRKRLNCCADSSEVIGGRLASVTKDAVGLVLCVQNGNCGVLETQSRMIYSPTRASVNTSERRERHDNTKIGF